MHRFKLFFVMACMLIGLTGPTMAEVVINDGCGDVGNAAADIDTVTASFDDITGDITVVVPLCASAGDKLKYRVHFDHTVPFSTDPDRNGDMAINVDDNCVTTSDATMMQRRNRATGPGMIDILGGGPKLTYIVNMLELNDQLQIGDAIQIWVDTQDQRIVDTAPDVTSSLPGCEKPDSAVEVIQLPLAPADCASDPAGCLVFVTSQLYNANFGGLLGADAQCQQSAGAAGLTGTFKAWLSDSTTVARDRLAHAVGPYKRVDGAEIAKNWADLIDGSLDNLISVTETGAFDDLHVPFAWTDTNFDGRIVFGSSFFSCQDWTSQATDFSAVGVIGDIRHLSSRWTSSTQARCFNELHLYCFEQ